MGYGGLPFQALFWFEGMRFEPLPPIVEKIPATSESTINS